jgi:hypothetical protein
VNILHPVFEQIELAKDIFWQFRAILFSKFAPQNHTITTYPSIFEKKKVECVQYNSFESSWRLDQSIQNYLLTLLITYFV